MDRKKLLVVATAQVETGLLRDAVREHAGGDADIRVVYMTAASAGEWTANGVPLSVLLIKPFAPAQIVSAVSNLLNAADPSPV